MSYSYDNLNRRIQVKDATNALTLTTYNKVGDVITVTDALNRTTNYAYDALSRQIGVTDALNHTNLTSYNAVGNILTTTDALNRTTSYSYDNLNRKISTTDALNQTQSVTYDRVGNTLTTTDELGRTTNYGYDSLDRQTTITNPLGQITTTSYDSEGNVTSTKDSLNNITRYLYDNNNRQIQVIDAKGGITKTSYDAVGNVATITDSVNNITTYGYDAVDRLITDTNQLNKTRTRSYDNVGNLTQTVDRNGRKVAYNYDTLNRQTAERWLDGSNATIKTFSSSYDAVGHLLSSTNPDSVYTYSYDAVDRILSIDNTGTVGVPAVKFNYSYDAVGNLVAVNDSINGISAAITGYTYDLLNRVTRLNQSGTGVQTKRVDMAYNAVNQLTSLSRYSGNNSVVDTNYVYDNNQRLIKLAHQKGANTIASYDYSYDAADKLASTVSSVDGTSNYSYDATNQLTSTDNTSQADEAYIYDANGNRTNGSYVTGTNNQLLTDGKFNYQYDDEGNRTRKVEIATGEVTSYAWDYRNRLISVTVADVNGVVIKSVTYTYDVNNRRIGKVVDNDGVGAATATVERFVYDGNQISLVFDGGGNQTHRYLYGAGVDQVLADETVTGTNWAVTDKLGTVTDVIDSNGLILNHIVYDSFGKVVTKSDTSFEFRYGFTGREYDGETGLDYYRARYYDSGNGRFIGEDPLGFGAEDANLTRYVFNSPTNFVDPSGLRPLTKSENNLINQINTQLEKIKNVNKRLQVDNTVISNDDSFINNMKLIERDFVNEIKKLKGSVDKDPARIKALKWALQQWLYNPDKYSSQKLAKGYNGLRDIEAGSAKCNVFVGDTYAVGGDIGYGDGRYPIRRPAVKFWLPATPLSANDLQNRDNRINKFPISSNPKIGDIISFPPHGNEDDGHTGIYLGHGLYMSARAGMHPGSGVQTENGVMITRIPYNDYPGQIVYRTYNPHDSTFTHGR